MSEPANHSPRSFQGVMVSSTFTDLIQHRQAVIRAIEAHGLKAIVMEHDSAKPGGDVIDSSLGMVRDAAAYVGVISRKYGQVPTSPSRNPENLSLTELEFGEAEKLGRPILLFIMGKEHPVTEDDIEFDPAKRKKLESFREKAKQASPDSAVQRVFQEFNCLQTFEISVMQAVGELANFLKAHAPSSTAPEPRTPEINPGIPKPPQLYAEPPYIGSHQFLGRQTQLQALDNWASPANPYPFLLFEAIGGTGKSILTWHWLNHHALNLRSDWAGRFWYSFYERGAVMADFCQRALAYMTGQALPELQKLRTSELGELLLQELQTRPWLLVLDGLERILVSYHRFDAAHIPDEAAGDEDIIAHRDPCAAIRPEDDELLRLLAAAVPSKLLVTSRLTPKSLLNAASQPIPGILRERLTGLKPQDAEDLLRSCGIVGDSAAMQTYLQEHCDCHPLTTGVLAGLIHDYLPDRGNFDAWAGDPEGEGLLNLAQLDLVQKRNHILLHSIASLPENSRHLLFTLGLLSESLDYATLSAFNPHNPPTKSALAETVRDLEKRGLLQYDEPSKRYDLHPVVRGVAVGGLSDEETERYGGQVVDYFAHQPQVPFDQVKTMEDLHNGLMVVRTLLQMKHYEEAYALSRGDMANALGFNLEAHGDALTLLRPFFPQGWRGLPKGLPEEEGAYLANAAAYVLNEIGEKEAPLTLYSAVLPIYLRKSNWHWGSLILRNLSLSLNTNNLLAQEDRCLTLCLELAEVWGDGENLFMARLFRFFLLARLGRWQEAEALWNLLDPMGRDWNREIYRPGFAELCYACFRFWRGDLQESVLSHAEKLAQEGMNRLAIRELHGLRGRWNLELGQWDLAADHFHEAVRMAREIGQANGDGEIGLALAKLQLGQLPVSQDLLDTLEQAPRTSPLALSAIFLALGEREGAIRHALAAYRWAWADGEPYVRRFELNRAAELLAKLGEPIPQLSAYQSASADKPLWEGEAEAAIAKLGAGKPFP